MIIEQNALIEGHVPRGILRPMTQAEKERLAAPFVDPPSRGPLYMWTNQIPIEGQPLDVYDIATRYHDWLMECNVPKLLFWATPGVSVTAAKAKWYLDNMKEVRGVDLGEALHFSQEDHPKAIGAGIREWIQSALELK